MSQSFDLKSLATHLFMEIAPKSVGELDRIFERWKIDVPRKQEVNFSTAMPTSMRERILLDIGFGKEDVTDPPRKYFGYLQILNRLLERNIEEVLQMSVEDLQTLVRREAARIGLREVEVHELANVLPHWIQKISNKVIFEFSPLNVCEMGRLGTESTEHPAGSASNAKFKGIIGQSEKMQSIFSCL